MLVLLNPNAETPRLHSLLSNSGIVPRNDRVLRLIQKVEKSNIMVLVTGQSGTGKELVAKALHYNSPRSRKPFVTVKLRSSNPLFEFNYFKIGLIIPENFENYISVCLRFKHFGKIVQRISINVFKVYRNNFIISK